VGGIHLTLHFNSDIRFPELNASFTSLRPFPQLATITFVSQRKSIGAQFDAQILSIPRVRSSPTFNLNFAIKHGVHFSVSEELQPIVDYVHHPSFLTWKEKHLKLRLKGLNHQAHRWLLGELTERFRTSLEKCAYRLEIELAHQVDLLSWPQRYLENPRTGEVLIASYESSSIRVQRGKRTDCYNSPMGSRWRSHIP